MKMVLNDFVKLWMPMKTAATCPWWIGFVPSLPGAEAFAEQLVPASWEIVHKTLEKKNCMIQLKWSCCKKLVNHKTMLYRSILSESFQLFHHLLLRKSQGSSPLRRHGERVRMRRRLALYEGTGEVGFLELGKRMEFWAWIISNNEESFKSVGKGHHIPKEYNGTCKSRDPKRGQDLAKRMILLPVFQHVSLFFMDLLEKHVHYTTKSPFHSNLGTSWLRWRCFGPHQPAAPRLHGDFQAKGLVTVMSQVTYEVGSHHNISIIYVYVYIYIKQVYSYLNKKWCLKLHIIRIIWYNL